MEKSEFLTEIASLIDALGYDTSEKGMKKLEHQLNAFYLDLSQFSRRDFRKAVREVRIGGSKRTLDLSLLYKACMDAQTVEMVKNKPPEFTLAKMADSSSFTVKWYSKMMIAALKETIFPKERLIKRTAELKRIGALLDNDEVTEQQATQLLASYLKKEKKREEEK